MKISGNNQNPITKDAEVGKTVTDNSRKAKSGNTPDPALVSPLSDSVVGKIKSALAKSPDMNAAKVAELKNQIKNGTFSVHSEKIADGLVKEFLDSRATNTSS